MSSPEVVAFEFLGTEAKADSLLRLPEWQPADPPAESKTYRLRQNTYWDFLFIAAYVSSLLFLARFMLGEQNRHSNLALWILIAAGTCDALENLCLLQILDGARGWIPGAMWFLAGVKFGLLVLAVVWMVIGFLIGLLGKTKA